MIAVIFNPSARGDRAEGFRQQVARLSASARLLPTASAGDATRLAYEAGRDGGCRHVGDQPLLATTGHPAPLPQDDGDHDAEQDETRIGPQWQGAEVEDAAGGAGQVGEGHPARLTSGHRVEVTG